MMTSAVDGLIGRFSAGDRAALARLLSYIENQPLAVSEIFRSLPKRHDNAHVIGITGPPGVGKSTLVGALIRELRAREKLVGVIAVDPSSSFTGGAALGDRVRMKEAWSDPGVYIRSMATRGQLGGLSRSVGDASKLLAAFGFDVVLVETVGVGQDEIDVSNVVDTTILVQVPGLGDEIQAIKAGVFEIADIFVVNKVDLEGADSLVQDLRRMLLSDVASGWKQPIVETMAISGTGIEELIDELGRHRNFVTLASDASRHTISATRNEVARIAFERFSQSVNDVLNDPSFLSELEKVIRGAQTSVELAETVTTRIICGSPETKS